MALITNFLSHTIRASPQYFQKVIEAFKNDIKKENEVTKTEMVPDMNTTEFVKMLKLSLITNKYPSVPYYNVRGDDFQVLPSVIDDWGVSEGPQRKRFKSVLMQKRYDVLSKQMKDLKEKQRMYDDFNRKTPERKDLERRNSF